MLAADLPDPDAHPQRDIVIWDGRCRFCRQQVERLEKFSGGRLAYLSLHDPRVAARFPELTHEQLMEQMWVVTRDGQMAGGADAVRVLSRRLPRLWWLAPLLHLPGAMPLWRWLYRWFARRRYRIAGKCDPDGTCHLHSPGDQSQGNAQRNGKL
ncbi:MAG: DUF393 domain-containing protein [Planctomycetota bacterium]|nr:MAG: DUF393 domain-containing protein [Planctomycetota bacterium]